MADIIAMFSRWAKSGLTQMFSRVTSSSDESASSSMEPIRRSALGDFQRIIRMLPRIEAVLEDAEEREVLDRYVNLWLSELRVLAYEIDDVVDEYDYEVLRVQIETKIAEEAYRYGKRKRDDYDDGDGGGEGRNILASSSSQVPLISDGMAHKLREIRQRFDEIESDRKALRLREEDGVRRFAAPQRTRLTSSLVDESSIFGREGDKEKIMEKLLLNTESSNNFAGSSKIIVIPIVGMGGVGKTTLAQLIYNDPKIREYFDLRVWIHVSDDFDLMRLTKEIYKSITNNPCQEDTGYNYLQVSIKNELLKFNRKFLVLDDVWNEEQSSWKSLQLLFHDAGIVHILMTTRSERVADVMRTTDSICLNSLSIEAACALFQKFALCDDDTLMKIGYKIVEKCGRLPLAVKLLGSHLRFKRDEDEWKRILESEIWDLKPGKNEILPSLRLSYQRMPMHLKPCFKYLSMFPKNRIPNKNRLVWLWMAQGYIQSKATNKTMEELGGEYFDELLERSLLQPTEWKNFFKVHDLIFDLIVFISGEELVILKLGDDEQNKIISNNVRHLVLHDERTHYGAQNDIPAYPSINKHLTLRSILYHGQSMFNGFQFPNSMQLRTLHLDFGHFDPTSLMLLRSIASLKHLRYLYLGMRVGFYLFHRMDYFPDIFNSFSRLYNFQVLDLSHCNGHFKLQASINNLINLRHLILPRDSPIPCGISKLTSLQTLKPVVVKGGSNECGGLSEIEGLANLTGNCRITNLRYETNVESVKKANINKKKHIQKLCLFWNGGFRDDSFDVDISFGPNYKEKQQSKELAEAILEALRPHNNLKGFKLYNYPGIRFPLWLGDPSYSKLQELNLYRCKEWDGSCGVLDRGLPCLQKISITSCAKLKQLKIVQSSSLREFLIQNCPELSTLHGLCNLLILEKLEIRRCNNLMISAEERLPSKLHSVCFETCKKLTLITGLQHLHSLKELELSRCYNVMISVEDQRLPSKLHYVHFEDCWKLTSITGLQHLRFLEELKLIRCLRLQLSLDEQLLTTHAVVKVTDCLRVMEWCQRYGFEYIQEVFKIEELMYHDSGDVSIKNLHICNYNEANFVEDDCIPRNLNTLILRDCLWLRLLPPYQNMSALRQLKIWDCWNLEYLQGLQLMKSLENLEIINCANLNLSLVQRLPSKLQYLLISKCPRLKWLPGLQQLLCLRDLKLRDCCELMLLPAEQLPFMHQVRLVIINCPKLGEWCRRYNLSYKKEESLFARSSQQIKEAPVVLDNLCVLDYDEAILETQNWPEFKLLGLNVCSCVHLKSIMFDRNMENLKKVRIWNCPQLEELCRLCYLRRPEEIDISNCRNLRFLWHHKSFLIFRSKESAPGCFFKISKCPKLYFDYLFDDFFNSRDVVEIHACPQLQELCEQYHFAAYFQD